ncbi:Zn-dependent peptidase ImmA (M78 family) [Pedobacter cryoconitis]|uniref:Zn-dependent peptidase ImmA (M78 family) n=1 Tax=Pedobacter cryoconitis TaxID=188932 RepID=A0A7W8ZNH2_9SPHI|nr:XRE family transcriptional regulator [Pedobacter cryoconitis]MBB5637276.1 Zn-dependent peptidase ImmA (M78 family) [Pedobacter cryoconitis]
MSFDLIVFGKKLLRCRDNLHLSQTEVSVKIGISIPRLKKLEEGLEMPSGDEVLIFADFYKQDYQFFITNDIKSAIDKVQILYRKHGAEFSKQDRWIIQEFLYLCECEQQVFELTKFSELKFDFTPKGDYYKMHGIHAALELRRMLNLKPDDLIIDIYGLFRKLGIHIFRRKLQNSSISGLFINHPRAGKCILVNYDEDIYRQNFTVAHEVGHAIFDFKEDINISFNNWDKHDLREIRANTFASNFLIPKEIMSKRVGIQWNKHVVINLAKQLKINIQPLIISLMQEKLIDESTYYELKSIKIPMIDKVDPELQNLSDKRYESKSKLLEKGLSQFYVQACYRAYSDGLISSQRLAEMFLEDEGGLRSLLSQYNFYLSYEH